jgi:hypothetical protein
MPGPISQRAVNPGWLFNENYGGYFQASRLTRHRMSGALVPYPLRRVVRALKPRHARVTNTSQNVPKIAYFCLLVPKGRSQFIWGKRGVPERIRTSDLWIWSPMLPRRASGRPITSRIARRRPILAAQTLWGAFQRRMGGGFRMAGQGVRRRVIGGRPDVSWRPRSLYRALRRSRIKPNPGIPHHP